MEYPFITLDNGTQISHSEMLADRSVLVYIRKDAFHRAVLVLPRAGMARGHRVYGRRARGIQQGHPEDDLADSGVFAKRRLPRCLWS